MLKNFLKCGLTGWCMEISFTALDSLRRRDMTLKGCTSLWMFPIYGCIREVFEYIEQAGKYGIVPGLDNIRALCGKMGNPQKELRFVHVAGTNGKHLKRCRVCHPLLLHLPAGLLDQFHTLAESALCNRSVVYLNTFSVRRNIKL